MKMGTNQKRPIRQQSNIRTIIISSTVSVFFSLIVFFILTISFTTNKDHANNSISSAFKSVIKPVKAAGIQMVVFVVGPTCPAGFTNYTAAHGRFILGEPGGGQGTGGTGAHTHTYSGGTAAIATTGGAGTGSQPVKINNHAHSFSGTTAGPNDGLPPFIQLKPCIWTYN